MSPAFILLVLATLPWSIFAQTTTPPPMQCTFYTLKDTDPAAYFCILIIPPVAMGLFVGGILWWFTYTHAGKIQPIADEQMRLMSEQHQFSAPRMIVASIQR
jgi:hypothetical protein